MSNKYNGIIFIGLQFLDIQISWEELYFWILSSKIMEWAAKKCSSLMNGLTVVKSWMYPRNFQLIVSGASWKTKTYLLSSLQVHAIKKQLTCRRSCFEENAAQENFPKHLAKLRELQKELAVRNENQWNRFATSSGGTTTKMLKLNLIIWEKILIF